MFLYRHHVSRNAIDHAVQRKQDRHLDCQLNAASCRENVQKNYRALREQGLNVDIIAMEHDLADYKVLAAPMAYMFKDGYEEKLRAYVENGGTLVLSYWSGIVDETDKCYLEGTPHGLMEAAGIRTEEIDALYDWEENHAIPLGPQQRLPFCLKHFLFFFGGQK